MCVLFTMFKDLSLRSVYTKFPLFITAMLDGQFPDLVRWHLSNSPLEVVVSGCCPCRRSRTHCYSDKKHWVVLPSHQSLCLFLRWSVVWHEEMTQLLKFSLDRHVLLLGWIFYHYPVWLQQRKVGFPMDPLDRFQRLLWTKCSQIETHCAKMEMPHLLKWSFRFQGNVYYSKGIQL